MSKNNLRNEKVIIACTDANGGPTMVAYSDRDGDEPTYIESFGIPSKARYDWWM